MARPSVISLELPTQGFSFQDVESSIIMFPFRRRKERKTEKGREREGEREWGRDESQTLMVPEWGFVHLLHFACPSSSALSLTTPETIKDLKYRFLFFFHPPMSLSLSNYLCYPCLQSFTDVYISVLSDSALDNIKFRMLHCISYIAYDTKFFLPVIKEIDPLTLISSFSVYYWNTWL